MNYKIFLPLIFSIFLLSSVSAVIFDAEWQNGSQLATIINGQSITLNIPDGGSMNPPTTLIIKLDSSTIHTKIVNDKSFSFSYTLNPSDYNSLPGTYEITITGTDSLGSWSEYLTLTVNPVIPPANHAPVITSSPITSVNENNFYAYQVAASDSDGDVLTYTLVSAPSWLSISTGTGLMTGTAPFVLANTSYPVTVSVSDGQASAIQSYSLTVIDIPTPGNAPIITILGSNPATIQAGFPYTDAGATATDAEDGNLTAGIIATNNVNVSLLGNYTVIYSVTDSANNTITATRNVSVVDTTASIVTLNSPANNTITNNTLVTFNGTVTDNVGVATVFLYLNGVQSNVSAVINNSDYLFTLTLPNGVYVWNYQACDTSANCTSGSANRTLTVNTSASDTTLPQIQFVSPTPANNSALSQNSIPINVTASDASGIQSIVVRLYNSNNILIDTRTSTASSFSFSFTSLASGTYYINAATTDNAGNANSTETRKIILSSGSSSSSSGTSGKIIHAYNDFYEPQSQEQTSKVSPQITLGGQKESSKGIWLSLVVLIIILILGAGAAIFVLARKR
jgi:hypothetical protein